MCSAGDDPTTYDDLDRSAEIERATDHAPSVDGYHPGYTQTLADLDALGIGFGDAAVEDGLPAWSDAERWSTALHGGTLLRHRLGWYPDWPTNVDAALALSGALRSITFDIDDLGPVGATYS